MSKGIGKLDAKMTLSHYWILFGVIVLLILTALVIYAYLHSGIKDPDGYARITGPCGDTMEVVFKCKDGLVEDIRSNSSGCSISKLCALTAGALARGKPVSELTGIDRNAIMTRTGTLPESHQHCALLAEITLQAAVKNYLSKNKELSSA